MSAKKAARMLIRNPSRSADIGTDIWWAPNKSGYTTDIAAAGAYTRDEAMEIHWSTSDSAAEAVPVTADVIASMEASVKRSEEAAELQLRTALETYNGQMKKCWELGQHIQAIKKEINENA